MNSHSKLLKKTEEYLNKLLKENAPVMSFKPKAVIFDVDDTLISTQKPVTLQQLGSREVFLFPAIVEMVRVAQLAKRLGYHIIIITARPSSSRYSTEVNLRNIGVEYDKLYVNENNEHISFKIRIRTDILKTHNVLCTIGDQPGDVIGPKGMIGIKLPSIYDNTVKLYTNDKYTK